MADRNRNAALKYDFAPREKDERIQTSHYNNKNIMKNRKIEVESSFIVMVVTAIIAVTLSLIAVLYNKVQVTQMTNMISSEQYSVQQLRDENSRMKAEIQSKNSQKTVEEYAEKILGMQKLDKSQCEYISLESSNVIEIAEDSNDFFINLKNKFSEFMDYIRG